MDFWSICIVFTICLSITNCAPTENSTSTIEASTSASIKSTPCTQPLCPEILCIIGYKRINVPCSCPKCVPDNNSNITTISLSTKSEHGKTTGNHNLSTTIGFPRHVCRFACKVESCKEGEVLVRNPSFLCSCPRCEPIQSTTEGIRSPDPSTLDKYSLSSTHCIEHCPLIICKPGEKLEQTPGQCQCPKCVPIEEQSTLKTQSVRPLPIKCKFLCKIPSCPPGEILYRDPSYICSCPQCIPDPSSYSHPPFQCKFVCPPIDCPFGETLYKNPTDICACLKCMPDPQPPIPIRTTRLTYECKVTCPDYVCAPGQRLEKDPADGCSCPRCVPDTPYIPEPHCDLLFCPALRCVEGEVVVREARECTCPKCECIRPPVCPAQACAGIWKYPTCGCPICLVSYDVETY